MTREELKELCGKAMEISNGAPVDYQYELAHSVLNAISAAGLAVVPRDADLELADFASDGFHVEDSQDAWKKAINAGDLLK